MSSSSINKICSENFRIHYNQDESYCLLDTKKDTYVYFGIKTDITKEKFFDDLRKSQKGVITFTAEGYKDK